MNEITTIRHEIDATASIYRGTHHCGMVFCPTPGGRTDYLASPWTDAIAQRAFATEGDAIDYLGREA